MTKEEKTIVASPIMERTPAADYAEPKLTKVASNISAKDDSFIPKPSFPGSPSVDLVANIEGERIQLSHRSVVTVDCGFQFTLPSGYRAYVNAKEDLAKRGLCVSHRYFEGESDVKVTVTNIGKEILYIEPGQVFAEMVVQPVYQLNWISD